MTVNNCLYHCIIICRCHRTVLRSGWPSINRKSTILTKVKTISESEDQGRRINLSIAMSSSRILAYLQRIRKNDPTPRLATFAECVVDYFEEDDGKAQICVKLEDNKLVISDIPTEGHHCHQLFIEHPSFCPVKNLSAEQASSLPQSTHSRGINTGAAVILESADGKVLLTKRAAHLHTFPGIWVPPGGHIEENETLSEAGLRELYEETGLKVEEKDFVGEQLEPLALWESVYPSKLSFGLPARHHIVVYMYGKLKDPLTSERLFKELTFDLGEVAACTWLDRDIISAIVCQNEETGPTKPQDSTFMPETIRALVLDEAQKQVEANIPLAPFLQCSVNTENGERVSTGTKYGLEQFLLRAAP